MKTNFRNRFSAKFKAEVALAALDETSSLADIGRQFKVHPVLVGQWKRQLERQAAAVFEGGQRKNDDRMEGELLRKIGELTVERDFLARGLRRSR
jgi:transposase